MAEFRKICDVYQGYNFKKDVQTPVGYVTELKIGDTQLTADQTVKDPQTPANDLSVVAVVSDILWQLGVTDAVYVSGQVSVSNRQSIALLVINDLTKVEVLFKFSVYEYDPVAKKYFKCFQCNDTQMKGILEKNGQDLNLRVSDDASTQVQSPLNFGFDVGVKPQPTAQTLTVATADQKNVVKAWGLNLT